MIILFEIKNLHVGLDGLTLCGIPPNFIHAS